MTVIHVQTNDYSIQLNMAGLGSQPINNNNNNNKDLDWFQDD